MGIKEEIYKSMDVGTPAKKYVDTNTVTKKVVSALGRKIIGLNRFYENVQECHDNKNTSVSSTSNIRLSNSAITLRNKIMGAFE